MSKPETPADAAWFAEHVMGWRRVRTTGAGIFWTGKPGTIFWTGDTCLEDDLRQWFRPLYDANDALAMLEAWCEAAPGMRLVSLNRDHDGAWRVWLCDRTRENEAHGDTLCAAACAAVRQAVEGES